MGRAFSAAVLGLVLLATGSAARGQPINLPDGNFASTTAYLIGTWKWERPEPRQTMIMRFGTDGSFFFHNFTIDLQHWGTYVTAGQHLELTLTRSCEEQGKNCETRDPPKKLEYTITPASANVFQSNQERWERMK